MYDRATESWWQQFSRTAIVGALAGTRLKMLPSQIVSFQTFASEHPEGPVLVPNDLGARPYGSNPYPSYDTAARPFLFCGELPADIPAMAHVVIVNTSEDPIIVSLSRIRDAPFERDGYVFTFEDGVSSALDSREIAAGRDIGAVRVTLNGADVVHHTTFAFVAHVFHPDVAILQ